MHEHINNCEKLDTEHLKPGQIADLDIREPGAFIPAVVYMGAEPPAPGEYPEPGECLMIVDMRQYPLDSKGRRMFDGQLLDPSAVFLAIDPMQLDWQNDRGYKGIRPGESVTFGRAEQTTRFPRSSGLTSRRHMSVMYDEASGKLRLSDEQSSNGTTIVHDRMNVISTPSRYPIEYVDSYEAPSVRVEARDIGVAGLHLARIDAALELPERPLQDQVSSEASERLREQQERARLEKLFAFPDKRGADKYGNSLAERARFTDQSEEDASFAYRFAKGDSMIAELFSKYKGDKWREEDMPSVLRDNNALRVELGSYLLAKLKTLNRLPSRFYMKDNLKNPNHPGYGDKMTSVEYATLLALSMLDGTFKSERARYDQIEMNKYGDVTVGQHRYAALAVLGLEHTQLAKIKREQW